MLLLYIKCIISIVINASIVVIIDLVISENIDMALITIIIISLPAAAYVA